MTLSRRMRVSARPPEIPATVSQGDRLYLRAYGKLVLCERRRPDEEAELRRRRLADGSYPVPEQIDDFRSQVRDLPGPDLSGNREHRRSPEHRAELGDAARKP